MAENVKVVVRCRPMSSKEYEKKFKNIIKIKDCTVSIENPNDEQMPAKIFTYDNAYDTNAVTEAIYNDICYSLVENVLEGYNGTIFAYGQTGCGKSYTMQGPETIDLKQIPPSQRGIISKSFDHIFEAISVATGVRYLALATYLEIYNENIRDLLNSNDIIGSHQLKEIASEGVVAQNLTVHTVHNVKECVELLKLGNKNRSIGSTLMNAGSSRSHSIFTLSLEQIESNVTNEKDTLSGIKKGKLNLVDLAGSERQNKTGASGDRLKEATKINLSLSALGNVISALVDGRTKHIPYRDSKLTRLLQDSLGGNTKTLMIACISPADYNYDETLSTLRYACRAKNIRNKPRINEDPKDTILRQYQDEIFELRKLLQSTVRVDIPKIEDQQTWIENETSKLRAEYEKETAQLKRMHELQQKEKEELVKDMERLKSHYEIKLKELNVGINEQNNNISTNGSTNSSKTAVIQQEVLNRIETIKNALIGGEKANDIQLKEKRYRKKLAAQRRLSALACALSRVEQIEDRDLLQEHYSDIQQELKVKTDSLKAFRQKIRVLEREISDLQSEFQLDRADYLETIRRLERSLKFYQQLFERVLPILRKDGKYWDPDLIKQDSYWNDDLKRWKLPEDTINHFKLPPAAAVMSRNYSAQIDHNKHRNETINVMTLNHNDEGDFLTKKFQMFDGEDIADSYFRPRRATELIHQAKDHTNRIKQTHSNINVLNTGMEVHNRSTNFIDSTKSLQWPAKNYDIAQKTKESKLSFQNIATKQMLLMGHERHRRQLKTLLNDRLTKT